MIARIGALVLLASALGGAALADENRDLDLIPQGVTPPPVAPAPSAGAANQRIYLEDAVTLSTLRSGLAVPFPAPAPANWQERPFLDLRKEWKPEQQLGFTLSDRFNLRAADNLAFPSHQNVVNDFREAYASWEPRDRTYLDVGRINLKSGVALGFNPTDFFRTRAVVEPLSSDPTVLREDRLGAVMLRGQHIWDGGAVTVAFAPKLANPTKVYNATDLRSLDPSFDRTNDHNRFLLKGSVTLAADVAPELLLYREGGRTSYGANLTESLGQSIVAYAEWAGGKRPSLVEEAIAYGRATASLPASAPNALPADRAAHFANQLSVGASYTTAAKITFNLEYHFYQPGFAGRDWQNWFRIGAAPPAPAVPAELWYIRSYALEQQDPISEHAIFLRADWVDAFIPDLELTGLVTADLFDGSSLAQVTADYYLSNEWTIGGVAAANLGRRHSDFGSLPQTGSLLLKLARYF